jgi:hypothetical protein
MAKRSTRSTAETGSKKAATPPPVHPVSEALAWNAGTPSVIVAADIHLARCPWVSMPDLWGDAYHAFMQIIQLCVGSSSHLILAGDILDTFHPSSEVAAYLRQGGERMAAACLKIFVIKGNHDDTVPAWTDLFPAYVSVDRQLFQPCSGVTFYGLDYRHGPQCEQALAAVPEGADVLICHQLLDRFFPKEGSYNMKADWVPSQVQAPRYRRYRSNCRRFRSRGGTAAAGGGAQDSWCGFPKARRQGGLGSPEGQAPGRVPLPS